MMTSKLFLKPFVIDCEEVRAVASLDWFSLGFLSACLAMELFILLIALLDGIRQIKDDHASGCYPNASAYHPLTFALSHPIPEPRTDLTPPKTAVGHKCPVRPRKSRATQKAKGDTAKQPRHPAIYPACSNSKLQYHKTPKISRERGDRGGHGHQSPAGSQGLQPR